MAGKTPQIRTVQIAYRDRIFDIEYFHREGNRETILFVHGLGGAKENFWEACKTDALVGHTLICFDNPGTGNSTYYNDLPLDIDDLVAITALFVDHLIAKHFILVGTSMGGLTTLLYLKRAGLGRVKAYINIEGNLMPEDCMFSSKVVTHDLGTFVSDIFPRTIASMRQNENAGYHIIANNLELNTNVVSYYHYSFQTVRYSATGELLRQFIDMSIPRIFIYGDKNKHLSYIPELIRNNMNVKAISNSNHFVFYDNPKEMYEVIEKFLASL